MQRLVRSPVFSGEDQLAALETLCAKAGVNGIALNFIKLMAKFTGRSEEQVEQDHDRDNFLWAEAARDYGIVDKVLQNRAESA